jgi:hypothetical protein
MVLREGHCPDVSSHEVRDTMNYIGPVMLT